MKKAFFLVITAAILNAGIYTNELIKCMVKHSSPKDIKTLKTWMFFAFAQDPDLKKYSLISNTKKEQINKKMGKYVTRLLSIDCKKEFKNAVKYEGYQAALKSFEYLGRIAAAAITNNKEVKIFWEEFAKYVDTNKFSKTIK